jgi:hypothetical protein
VRASCNFLPLPAFVVTYNRSITAHWTSAFRSFQRWSRRRELNSHPRLEGALALSVSLRRDDLWRGWPELNRHLLDRQSRALILLSYSRTRVRKGATFFPSFAPSRRVIFGGCGRIRTFNAPGTPGLRPGRATSCPNTPTSGGEGASQTRKSPGRMSRFGRGGPAECPTLLPPQRQTLVAWDLGSWRQAQNLNLHTPRGVCLASDEVRCLSAHPTG